MLPLKAVLQGWKWKINTLCTRQLYRFPCVNSSIPTEQQDLKWKRSTWCPWKKKKKNSSLLQTEPPSRANRNKIWSWKPSKFCSNKRSTQTTVWQPQGTNGTAAKADNNTESWWSSHSGLQQITGAHLEEVQSLNHSCSSTGLPFNLTLLFNSNS